MFLEKFLLPVLIAFLTFIGFRKLDDWKKRRSYSKLGVAIMDSLIEELNNGVFIMTAPVFSTALLPKKSWDGMKTVPDEVLLTIIEMSKGVKSESFPPQHIRIHCKNYFDHMTVMWEQAVNDVENRQFRLKRLVESSKYLESAQGVLTMVNQCKSMLETNSKKYFPK